MESASIKRKLHWHNVCVLLTKKKKIIKMFVNTVRGKKSIQSLVQLCILSLYPYDLLLVAHQLENANEIIYLR